MPVILEYVWIDAFGSLRSKCKTVKDFSMLENAPLWNFDGSSTGQAPSTNSEIILKPVRYFKNVITSITKYESYLILCECYDKDMNVINSNTRQLANEIFEKHVDQNPWYGLEQEYVIYDSKTNRPLGWPTTGYPAPQGPYYCSIGGNNAFGRHIVEEHYQLCLEAGLKISGTNGEVMPAQWEFQVGPCLGIEAGDHLWIARYILNRVAEKYGCYISYDPKPVRGDWNGSGCHANFSTLNMRQSDGIKYIYDAVEKLSKTHNEHIAVYGNNSERLSGTHETSRIDHFTSGVGDRTASVRIPTEAVRNGHGYLEDRRPASDCDPYLVTSKILSTVLSD